MKQILILDDSESYVKLTLSALEEAIPGCVVHHELTCEGAISVANAIKLDLIVVDFQLGNKKFGTDCIPELQKIQPDAVYVLWSSETRAPQKALEAKNISGVTFFLKAAMRSKFIEFFSNILS